MAQKSAFIKSLCNDNFFLITSDNYLGISSLFFGYAIIDNMFLLREAPDAELDIATAGLFCNIVDRGDELLIQQDFYCQYGLYIFHNADFWAVSNNFIYLVERLARDYALTVDKRYISLFLTQKSLISAIDQTAIDQIKELSQGQYITINKSNGALVIRTRKLDKYSLRLDTPEAIHLIGAWRDKYLSLYRNLCQAGYDLTIELSGGMDSRAAFAPAAPLWQEKVHPHLYSFTRREARFVEDYKIASRIASAYNAKLEKLPTPACLPIYPRDSVWIHLYTAGLVSENHIYPSCHYEKAQFRGSGFGGESLRGYGDVNRNQYIEDAPIKDINKRKLPLGDLQHSLLRAFRYLDLNYPEESSLMDGQKMYIHSRVKNHFGKNSLASFFCNIIYISPLLDPALLKLSLTLHQGGDPQLFFAMLFDRYLPEIKDLGFENKRSIKKDTADRAREINAKSAFTGRTFGYELNINSLSLPASIHEDADEEMPEYLVKIYESAPVRDFIITEFGYDTWLAPINYARTHTFGTHNHITRLLAVWWLHQIVRDRPLFPMLSHQSGYCRTGYVWQLMRWINTARMDIVNRGDPDNTITVLKSTDPCLRSHYPSWLTKNCMGLSCETTSNRMLLVLKITGDGVIEIHFRALHVLNIRREMIDVSIDYKNLVIYSRTRGAFLGIFHDIYDISIMNKFTVKYDIYDKEELLIMINFYPHDYKLPKLIQLISEVCNNMDIS